MRYIWLRTSMNWKLWIFLSINYRAHFPNCHSINMIMTVYVCPFTTTNVTWRWRWGCNLKLRKFKKNKCQLKRDVWVGSIIVLTWNSTVVNLINFFLNINIQLSNIVSMIPTVPSGLLSSLHILCFSSNSASFILARANVSRITVSSI